MKKSFSYDVFSDRECSVKGCTTKIKQRLINEKPIIKKCFKHYKEEALFNKRYIKIK